MKEHDRVWAKIDLDALEDNLEALHRAIAPGVSIIGVVKADGYGHGAVPIARLMEEKEYVSGFAVATVEEAVQLRDGGIEKPILVLGYTFPADYALMRDRDISAAVFTEQMLADLSSCAQRGGRPMKAHIAVDTGMSRIGVAPDASGLSFVKKAVSTPGLAIEGIFTHFATADEADKTRTREQFSKFCGFVEEAERECGVRIPLHHCSNSAGILDLPEMNRDAVRAGIVLYGLWPSDEVSRNTAPLQPLLSLYSKVAYVKVLPAGRQISYGGTFTASHSMRVATIPVGYADGYPRALSGKGEVLIAGRRAPILGRICMDQFMVDVTHIPEAEVGSTVTLIGAEGAERITMEELGERSGRFNYELACCLSRRIPRIYERGGKTVLVRESPAD